MTERPLEIEILYNAICPHLHETEREIDRAITELGLRREVRVHRHRVTTREEARDLGFVGSPTVRVNGESIVPQELEEQPKWDICRQYVATGGLVPYPPAEQIKLGIERALRE